MSLLGGILGGAIGFVTGGPAGAVLGVAGGLSKGGTKGVPFAKPSIVPTIPGGFAAGGPGSGIYTRPSGGGVVCPPGTACSGASTDGLCIGTCNPIPGGVVSPATGMGLVSCRGRGGAVVSVNSPIRGYHWNTGRYHVFGDCRKGTGAGDVEPCTRLVRNRRINPANGKAAHRAARRLNATLGLLHTIERTVQRTLRKAGASHRGRGSKRSAACGCGTKPCSCR